MDARVERLKTSRDALVLAANAKRLGNQSLEAEAISRAYELRALEEGFRTPAELAIAVALYAYEAAQSALKQRKFTANRTRQMLARHTPLVAAERMVMTSKPSQGYQVLEDAGRQELSFESIIDRFPEEFDPEAVKAARARLAGEEYKSPRSRRRSESEFASFNDALIRAQRMALSRFDGSLNEVEAWGTSRGTVLDGVPKKSGIAFKNQDNPNPAKRARNVSMRFGDRTALLEWMQTNDKEQPRFYVVTRGGNEPNQAIAGLPYDTSAAYASGSLRVVGIYEAEREQDAIDHYMAILSQFAPKSDTTTASEARTLSATEFSRALVDAALSEADRNWLIAHFYVPEATASMESLAGFLGYETHRAGNSQYGAAAGKVAKAIPIDSKLLTDGPYTQNMQWLATASDPSPEGHFQWTLRQEVQVALERLEWVEPRLEDDPDSEYGSAEVGADARQYGLSDTEIRQMMLSRRGQGRFRRDVLRFWDGCAVSGLRHVRLLLASHIKPWRESDPNERLDGFNGLALAPNLDRAFDQGLITFGSDGRILISSSLTAAACEALGIHGAMALRRTDARIERYLVFHREHRFKA